MASISHDKNGTRRLLVNCPDGKRRPIRLGRIKAKDAESIRSYAADLENAAKNGTTWDSKTATWVGQLSDRFANKLAEYGLMPKREKMQMETLGAFLTSYFDTRANLKPNTRRNYEATKRMLIDHYGEHRPLDQITAGDADEWQETLRKKLSAATVSREVKRARQFFRAAVRKRLLQDNPFQDLKTPAQVNSSREHFVTREEIQKVLDACPDAEWRLIVALSRFGGLRCPSEHLALRLGDVDWERNRITIHSPKTEHHPGGESRVIPLFPELRPYLEAIFDSAPPGTEFFITRNRQKNVNWRTGLLRIIKRAGLKEWERLFHNLRASRQTELTSDFPLHVVCEWIGNSATIADKHYLQVTEDHYRAAAGPPGQGESGAQSGALSGAKEARQAAQHVSVPAGNAGHVLGQSTKKARKIRASVPAGEAGESQVRVHATFDLVPPRGVEPLLPD